MDIEEERLDLKHYARGHELRIDDLRASLDRLTRELRLHEMIRGLAENSQLPEAMRNLAEMTGVESATSSEVRDFLAERGVSVPTELDIQVQGAGDDFSGLVTYRDDWFLLYLSWSSREGFQGQIVDISGREMQEATPAEDA
jgi:hypothetical protein